MADTTPYLTGVAFTVAKAKQSHVIEVRGVVIFFLMRRKCETRNNVLGGYVLVV